MSKLHLSIISLGLCLILGFGSLAAQGKGKGGNKKSQTTYMVDLIAGEEGLGVLTDCAGFAEGSNLEAHVFFDEDMEPCLMVTGTTPNGELTLSLIQISSKFTKKELIIQMFFRGPNRGEGYSTGDIPVSLLEGDPFSGESFTLHVDKTVTLIKGGQPNKGSVAFNIAVGHVVYMKME